MLGHRPQLDGLRGLAWAGVFVGHAGLSPFPGLADVAMYLFFGLSGFLISAVLIEERVRRDAISLRRFFARRALRLLPALAAFLAAWLVVVAIFAGQPWLTTVPGGGAGAGVRFTVALEGVGAALAYVTNWFGIFHVFTGYVPLGHLWSLAVEEQVYLLWAPLLALLLYRRRTYAALAALALAMGSTIESMWLHVAHRGDWQYMGTDSRSGAFLIGALVALVWSTGKLSWLRHRLPGTVVSAAALAALVFCAVPLSGGGPLRSYGAAWSIATLAGPLAVVSVVEAGTGAIARILSRGVITYIGRRSYALYLWHYVFLTWFRALGEPGVALALLSSLLAAELSWRIVEHPAMRLKQRRFAPVGAKPAPRQTDDAAPEDVRVDGAAWEITASSH